MTNIAVIIVAAGRGSRAGDGIPKQYRKIAGVSLLRRTLDALLKCLPTAAFQVVIHRDDTALYQEATQGLSLLPPVTGAETRQASVFNGLEALLPLSPEHVLVHDAARPFVDQPIIDGLLSRLQDGALAVIPGVGVVDTLKLVREGTVQNTIDREGLFAVQTPQAFNFGALVSAHRSVQIKQPTANLTDDAAVMEYTGHSVVISAGSNTNFKVTHSEDFKKAERWLMNAALDIRTGSGYDVHRFETGDHVVLCGIKVPFDKTLKGHSDADVALHALTDALLSSVAAGDIGLHFPPNEEKWKDIQSDIFITKASEIIRNMNGIIANVTICIICELPKIGPFSKEMQANVARILGIDVSRVSIQATTTEKLGFTGRGEGIAAQATATVRLPL